MNENIKFSMRKIVACILLTVVFTIFAVSCMPMRVLRQTRGTFAWVCASVFLLVVFFLATFFIPLAFAQIRQKISSALNSPSAIFANIQKIYDAVFDSRFSSVYVFLICCLSFLPTLLAYYPGIFGNDGPVEILQALDPEHPLTAHHPLIHIGMLTLSILLGQNLFGSDTAGLLIYSIAQIIIVSLSITYLLRWLKQRRASRIFRVFTAIVLLANPITQLLAINTTKDTIFSALFLLTALHLIDLIQLPAEKIKKGKYIAFFVCAVLMSLFRKQGYYLLALVLIGTLIF